MRYGKLVNGEIELAPNPLVIDGRHVFTNDPEIFAQQGYKPLTYSPTPDIPDGYIALASWVEEEDSIVRVWDLTAHAEEIVAGDSV